MKKKLIIPIIIMIILSSCTQVVVNTADEIRMNKWSGKTENGNVFTLSFKNDKAEFKVQNNNKLNLILKGLCAIDNKRIMIYNQSENEPYFFEYTINNNNLILKYDNGIIKLRR